MVEYFKWNVLNSRFEFSDDIHISGCGSFCDLSGSYYGLSGDYITHRDDVTNPHEVTFSQARDQEGGSDVSLAELEELTDASVTALHSHAGAGTDTLDNVCDRGNETDQDIHTSGNAIVDKSAFFGLPIFMNYDGPEGDSYIYWHNDANISGQYLKWDETYDRFKFSNELYVGGNIKAEGNLRINLDHADADAIIYFYKPTALSETLRWDKTNNRFKFSDHLHVDGNLGTDGDIFVNRSGPDGNSYLYFYDLGAENGEYLRWNDGGFGRFEFSDTLLVVGELRIANCFTLNEDFGNEHAMIYFNKPTSGSETLIWDKTDLRFEFSDDLFVDGTISGDYFVITDTTLPSNPSPGTLAFHQASGEFFGFDGSVWDPLCGVGNGGAATFLELTDTPVNYAGDGGKVVKVNVGENALEFAAEAGGGAGSIILPVEGAALGDGTAGSAAPALSLLTTSAAFDPQCRTFCLRFDYQTDEHCFWQFRLPANYSSGGRLMVQFYNVQGQATEVRTVRFESSLQAVTPGDATTMTALDLANAGAGYLCGTLTVLTAGTNIARLYEANIDMTSYLDGMVAGDFIQLGLRRDISDDNALGDMAVVCVTFEFNY